MNERFMRLNYEMCSYIGCVRFDAFSIESIDLSLFDIRRAIKTE